MSFFLLLGIPQPITIFPCFGVFFRELIITSKTSILHQQLRWMKFFKMTNVLHLVELFTGHWGNTFKIIECSIAKRGHVSLWTQNFSKMMWNIRLPIEILAHVGLFSRN